MGLLRKPNVAPLTEFVEQLRAEKPEASIPYFDPTEAGTEASILLLLEAPGARSALAAGSGFVSPDNNDQTASNMWNLLKETDIDRATRIVTWNVVPWYIGDGKKIRPALSGDLDDARSATERLLELLEHLRVVVLLGKPAARSWARLGIELDAIQAPHPSPLNLNTRPEARDEIRQALLEAKRKSAA